MDGQSTEHSGNSGADAGVVIFTASWSRACEIAKQYLTHSGVAFEEVDVESIPDAAHQVAFWTTGFRTVPTIRIGETIIVGWDKKVLDDAIASRSSTSENLASARLRSQETSWAGQSCTPWQGTTASPLSVPPEGGSVPCLPPAERSHG